MREQLNHLMLQSIFALVPLMCMMCVHTYLHVVTNYYAHVSLSCLIALVVSAY